MDQAELDARIRAYYSRHFAEDERLTARSAQGRLERERVQELVTARIAPGAGGATARHVRGSRR